MQVIYSHWDLVPYPECDNKREEASVWSCQPTSGPQESLNLAARVQHDLLCSNSCSLNTARQGHMVETIRGRLYVLYRYFLIIHVIKRPADDIRGLHRVNADHIRPIMSHFHHGLLAHSNVNHSEVMFQRPPSHQRLVVLLWGFCGTFLGWVSS